MKHYGIEVYGYGKRRKYVIKAVYANGTDPVDCVIYRTEAAARAGAEKLGLNIEAVGDLYKLLRLLRH